MTTILLTEQLLPSECNIIQESSQDGKSHWLSGIFMQAELKNRNGRVYPLSEISEAVRAANVTIKQNNGIFGELDHPATLHVDPKNVSHYISEMWMQGNNAFGKAKLMNTPMGSIAQEIIKSGVRTGISSRGAGNVNESGSVSGFQFITCDIVLQPSAPDAYPGSIYESLDRARNGKAIMTLAEQVREDKAAQKYLQKEILTWLSTGLFAKK